ncbi:MAG: AraC family transcriptional regulator [Flammeovirgaceae bacterium]|nr:AraC family transcriptional regulator [Flammeovirgaceae bacterium]
MAFIIQSNRENLDKSLTIDRFSEKVYMSESSFFRVFKNEIGISPIDFINNEQIKSPPVFSIILTQELRRFTWNAVSIVFPNLPDFLREKNKFLQKNINRKY